MIVYILLSVTFFFAILSLRVIGRASSRYIGDSWPALLFGLALGWFVYLYGTWVYLSVYLKYVFAAAIVITLFSGLLRNKRSYRRPGTGNIIGNIAGAIFFGTLCVLYYT